MEKSTWEELAKEMKAQEGGGIFFFLKEGRTRLRLVPEKGTENNERPRFWIDTEGSYNGKPNKRRILLGIVAGADGREIPDEDKNKVVPLLVAPSIVTQVVEILATGWDLFSAKEGHAIAIARSGSGLQTTYRVDVSPSAIPLPDTIQYLDKNLEELDVEYRKQKQGGSTQAQGTGTSTPETKEVESASLSDSGSGADW